MYIFDSNLLIQAYRIDFPPETDKEGFWDWFDNLGLSYDLIIPEKVFEEIDRGTDNLTKMLSGLKNIRKQPSANAMPYLSRVMATYGPLTQQELEIIERWADPFLAAHGLDLNATVVTDEKPNNATKPLNKKVPDICAALGVNCIRYPKFLWTMLKT